jgi:glutamine synthetase type III
VHELLKEIIVKHGAVIFNGDNYLEAWYHEAEKRGLPNSRSTSGFISDQPDQVAACFCTAPLDYAQFAAG